MPEYKLKTAKKEPPGQFKKHNMNKKIFLYLTIASTLIFFSCQPERKYTDNQNNSNNTNTTQTVTEKPRVIPPDFNSDSAYSYILKQAELGPRIPGSNAHKKAVNWFENFFKKTGADVKVMGGNTTTFDGKSWRIDNVIASYNLQAKNRILLSAHYDSRPFSDKDSDPANYNKPCPGVNDGASGVGVLMEVARQISIKQPGVGIDIVLFDLEDYGDSGGINSWALGSQDWAKNPHKPGYKAKYGILLDMVGAKNATFPKEGLSVFHANDVVNKIWNTAEKIGYGNYFLQEESAEMTDDHTAINKIAGIPCVDILHYNHITNQFFEYHHTTKDDINTIDKNTLKAVGQTLLEVIYNEE